MSFLHDIFFHDTRFEVSEASLAELHKFAEVVKYSGREAEGIRGNSKICGGEAVENSKIYGGEAVVNLSPFGLGECKLRRTTFSGVSSYSFRCASGVLHSSSEFQGVAESTGRSKSAIFGRDEVSYENQGVAESTGRSKSAIFGRDEVSYENASASSTQAEYFKELRSPPDIANPQFSGETKSRTKITKSSQIRLHHPTLFWCVFVAHYGYSEYLRIGNRFQNRELEEKQRIMETLSKNPKQMKEGSMKLTNDAIQEILSGLMVSSGDSFSAVVAYSMFYSKTIYVVFECSYLVFSMTKESGVEIFGRDEVSYKNRIFTENEVRRSFKELRSPKDVVNPQFSGETQSRTKMRSIPDAKRKEFEETPENEVRRSLEESDNTRTIVLYQTRKHPKYGGSYRLESDLTPEKLEHIHSTKIRMEHYAKPFRGISSYKVAELEKMAAKIGVLDATGKADLYAKIVEKCCLGIQTR